MGNCPFSYPALSLVPPLLVYLFPPSILGMDMTLATNQLPKPSSSFSPLSQILIPPVKNKKNMKNTKKKYKYLIFKGAFLEEIILFHNLEEIINPNENVIRGFDRVTSVWLESQLPIKKTATPAIYTLHGLWSLENHRCQWHWHVRRCDDRDRFSLPLIFIAKIGPQAL